jgi:hypothetical protein
VAAWLGTVGLAEVAIVSVDVAALATAIARAISTCISCVAATSATAIAATSGCRASAATASTMTTCRTRTFAFTHTGQHLGACGFGGCHHHVTARRLACAAPNGLAAHGNWLGLLTGFGHEVLEDLDRDVLLGVALNGLHETFFV